MCAKFATLSTTNDDSQTKIMYWYLLKVLCDINLLSSQTVEQVVLNHTSPELTNPSIAIDVSISKTFPVDLQNYYFFKYRKKNVLHFLKCLLKCFLTDFGSQKRSPPDS